MMKNLVPRFVLWLVLVTLLHSCRNDYIPEQNSGYNASNVSKFRIVTLKDVPKVEEYLHKKTGRPDFSIDLSKSVVNKGHSLPSRIDSSFIIEKKTGAVTYYVFGMKDTDNGRFYNFEIKETNGRFERAEIIEYKPDRGFSGDPMADIRSFSGTVAAYDTDGIKTAEQTYANGYTPCPSDDIGIGDNGGSGSGTGGGGGWNSGGGDGNGGGGSSGGGGIGNGGGLYGGGGGGGSGPGSTGPSGGSCGEYQLSHHLFSGGMLIGAVYINGCGQTKIYHMSEGMNRLTPRCNDGSGVGVWDDPKDPCQKTKKLINNAKTKPAIDALKTKSTEGGENGYKIKADGTPSDVIPGEDHSVKFGDKTGYAGGYHNHTPTGIPMLSPPDIDQLLQFALAQGNYGNPKNAFIGMVAPNGMHYVIWFNGSYNDALVTFSQEQLDEWAEFQKWRKTFMVSNLNYSSDGKTLNSKGLERLFYKTISDMGLDGKVILQKIENNGTTNNIISTVVKNNDGTTSDIPCPQ